MSEMIETVLIMGHEFRIVKCLNYCPKCASFNNRLVTEGNAFPLYIECGDCKHTAHIALTDDVRKTEGKPDIILEQIGPYQTIYYKVFKGKL